MSSPDKAPSIIQHRHRNGISRSGGFLLAKGAGGEYNVRSLALHMKFYIVTPAYNALHWLKSCVRSVADQACDGVEVHHHVQDGGSADGTVEWLREWQDSHQQAGYCLSFESAPDKGMYDAINKAWDKLPADAHITAHLNCDEQYAPGALQKVAQAASAAPKADMFVTSHIIIDAQNRYICHRRPLKPYKWVSHTTCEIITCACFHRVAYFLSHGVRFDTQWRSIGDLIFYRDILQHSPRVALLPHLFASIFRVTGSNLAWSDITQKEWDIYNNLMPKAAYRFRKLADVLSKVKHRLCNALHANPDSYEVYPPDASQRVKIHIKHPTVHWGCRTVGEE